MRILSRITAGICLLALSGCGYTFQGSGSDLPPDIKRIAIPFAENDSTEPGLSTVVTEALRDQFDKYGVITVVDEDDNPDAILAVKVLGVQRQTGTVTSATQSALQMDTVLTMSAELKRPNNQLLWHNPKLKISKSVSADKGSVVTSSADFASGSLSASDLQKLGDREVFRGQEQVALEDLAEHAATHIYDVAVTPDF